MGATYGRRQANGLIAGAMTSMAFNAYNAYEGNYEILRERISGSPYWIVLPILQCS